MKLATFEESGSARTGLITDSGVIDLAKADPTLPQDMLMLIREYVVPLSSPAGDEDLLRQDLEQLVASLRKARRDFGLPS